MQMTKAWKDMSAIPTSKPLVYSFTLFLMTTMAILLFRGRDIPPNIASLLSIVAPAIYGGYFLKSGYEHRVDRQYGISNHEWEETNDGSDCDN